MNEDKAQLVSAPLVSEDTAESHLQLLSTGLQRLCTVEPVGIPPFRFRNLDMLIESNEMIARRSLLVHRCLERVQTTLEEVAGPAGVDQPCADRSSFIRFQWNEVRYDMRDPISILVRKLIQETEEIEENYQYKLAEFMEWSRKLDIEQKKYTTNTASLPMSHLLKAYAKHDVPIGTEFLTTLFVVVPARSQADWLSVYTTLAEPSCIVPNSSVLVFSDATNAIFSVTIFRNAVQTFKKACIKRKWSVRDPRSEESLPEHSLDEIQNTTDRLRGKLVRLLYVSLSELRVAYTHLKVAECYIESILKYGLSTRFAAFLLRYRTKDEKSIRSKLDALFGARDASSAPPSEEEEKPYVAIEVVS